VTGVADWRIPSRSSPPPPQPPLNYYYYYYYFQAKYYYIKIQPIYKIRVHYATATGLIY